MNKKAFIKTLEAILAIIFILVFTYMITPKEMKIGEETPKNVRAAQEFILQEILYDDLLRGCVINSISGGCKYWADNPFFCGDINLLTEQNIPYGYSYTCEICNISELSCLEGQEELPKDKSVYVDSAFISSDIVEESKIVRLYFWREERVPVIPPEKTCQNQGYYCCDTCESGTEHSEYDDDCLDQICCGACLIPTCQNQGYDCCDTCESGTEHSEYDNNCPDQICCGACLELCIDNDNDGYAIEGGDCGEVDCDDNPAACGVNCNPGITDESTISCSDGYDNNCDGESDYDTQDGRHGDNDCSVAVTNIVVSASSPIENTNIDVDCTSSVANVNSIEASIDGVGICSFNTWSGNVAKFNCNVDGTGTKTVRCSVDTTKSYQLGSDQTTTITVRPSECSAYTISSNCEADTRCDWCSECSGTKYSGGPDRCVDTGTCSYYCWKGKCGATCDETQGTTTADYYYQNPSGDSPTGTDKCYLKDYYCTADCTEAYSDTWQYECGTCCYISSSSCTGTTLGSCSYYSSGTQGPTSDYYYSSGDNCYLRNYHCTGNSCGETYNDIHQYSCGTCKHVSGCSGGNRGGCANDAYNTGCGSCRYCDNGNCKLCQFSNTGCGCSWGGWGIGWSCNLNEQKVWDVWVYPGEIGGCQITLRAEGDSGVECCAVRCSCS